MKNRRIAAVSAFIVAVLGLVFVTAPVSAETSEIDTNEVIDHILYYGLYNCYTTDGVLKSQIKVEDIQAAQSVFMGDGEIFNEKTFGIPLGFSGSDEFIPCIHYESGSARKLSVVERLYTKANINVNNKEEIDTYYKGMGFNADSEKYTAKSDHESMYKSAFGYLSGKPTTQAVSMSKFDDALLYYIYVTYLKKYPAYVDYKECDDDGSEDPDRIPIKIGSGSSAKWQYCKINDYDNIKTQEAIVTFGDANWTKTSASLETLVSKIKALDIGSIDKERIKEKLAEEYKAGIPPSQQGEGAKTDECYEKAESLGWVLCPIVDGLKDFIIRKYGEWIEPALKMDIGLFKWGDSRQNGTYRAWAIFRDIGNFAFVILFIFIIFSQVTGLGIDNYGIKKALPKLLVSALLINLSFIICQAAIDVSNIAGEGIAGLFQGIKQQITIESVQVEGITVSPSDTGSWQDTKTWGTSFASNFLGNSAVIIIVCAISVGAVISQGLAILIPVVMLLISVAVAIFTLIAILGVRQAAAVLLVACSPVAFACYILPNTKKVFDKWFEAFKGLLLAFPICSALVYGGDMAGTILLQSANGNTWVLISAAVISIAPIFIIPKVISKSMGALSGGMANLGNRLSGFSKGKARHAMENSALTHRRNYNQQMRQQRVAASTGAYNAKRGAKTVARLRNKTHLGTFQRRKYNAAMGMVNANNNDATSAYTSSFVGRSDDYIAGQLLDNAKGRKPDANMIVAGLSSINDEDKLTATIKKLAETGALSKIKQDDPNGYSRIASVMAGRKDSVINQSIGKLMQKGETVEEMYSSGSLKQKVQGAGTSIMASQNKDVFKTEGAADLFSDDQLRAGLTAGYTGATAAAFYDMMRDVDDSRKDNIISGMSSEEIASLNSATIIKKDSSGNEYEAEVGSLAAIGATQHAENATDADKIAADAAAMARGAAMVRKKNEETGEDDLNSEVNALKSSEGREIRPTMQGKVMDALHIQHNGPEAINDSSISSGINVNDMSEDDYRYIQYMHDHSGDPGSAEGGIDIPHGDAAASATAAAAATAAATTPDFSSTTDTGTRRDAEGNITGSRAAEGNRFDYHPKQQGETNQDYSDRTKYEHALEAYGNANPRGENETSRDYYNRIQSPSYEDWKASGGGEIKLPADRGAANADSAPAPAAPASEPPAIVIPHADTPNPDAHIDLGGSKPNPDAHIDVPGPKPDHTRHFDTGEPKADPNRHLDLPGDKPNPNAHIDLGGAKPNPNAHIDLDTHGSVPPLKGTPGKPGASSHYQFGRKYHPTGRSFSDNRNPGGKK